MLKMTVDPWFGRRLTADVALRLFCLPCAGGGASTFRAWRADLPASIDLCPVQLPGREGRLHEHPFTAMEPLIAALADSIEPHLGTPYALFGHSMGALIAFELARELRRRGAPDAVRLFVAGFASPDSPRTSDPSRDRHRLTDRDLIAELRTFGGTPARLLNDPDVMRHVLPILRADFSVIETYRRRDEAPLDIPIAGLAGADDREAPQAAMTGWGRQSSAGFRLTVFPGDHFFVHAPTVRQAVIDAIARDLIQALAKVA
jgi:medium-chain acyl-[acyl-carrier-protein] hydrolase